MASKVRGLEVLLPTSHRHNFYFDERGVLKLILSDKHDYLTKEEIAEYLLAMPQIFDEVSTYGFPELVLSNATMGRYIREVFGMFHPNNKNVVYNENVIDPLSPENVSFAILKFVWIHATNQMTQEDKK